MGFKVFIKDLAAASQEAMSMGALQNNEEIFKLLAEQSADVIYLLDIESERYTYVSPSVEKILGYTMHESLSLKIRDTLTQRSYDMQREKLRHVLASGKGDAEVLELEAIHKDGRVLPIEVHSRLVLNDSKIPVSLLGIARDISERKHAEKEHREWERHRRQLQKAESLNRMAEAIAHHFNNLIGAVMGRLELALDNLEQGFQPHPDIAAAISASRQALKMSDLMLTYLGQVAFNPELLDLSHACNVYLSTWNAAIKKKVNLETDLASPGPYIRSDTFQIQELLKNLISNASEAIGSRTGSITVAVKTIPTVEIPLVHRFPIDWRPQHDTYACIEVKDTGCGIADKEIEQIFDPFFSSKFTGRGLGLPVVLGIVRAHQGVVTVESAPAAGSIFRIFFPLSA
jgi:PAS domain S-box-containing protein